MSDATLQREGAVSHFIVPPGFSFAEIQLCPKAQPTCRVLGPHRQTRRGVKSSHKAKCASSRRPDASSPIEYHLLHTGLFVRIATMPGRLYWMAQNSDSHRTPDWKLHIAVCPEWIPRVWDEVLLPVFLAFPTIARVGAKAVLEAERVTYSTTDSIGAPGDFVTTTDSTFWATEQYGREVTVYLFHDDRIYDAFFSNISSLSSSSLLSSNIAATKRNLWIGDNPDLLDHWRELTPIMEYSGKQLTRFVAELQCRLDALEAANPDAQICRRDTAVGDLKLTRAISVRNEAYATSNPSKRSDAFKNEDGMHTELQYPLNDWGWNAACHAVPASIRSCIVHFRGRSDTALLEHESCRRREAQRCRDSPKCPAHPRRFGSSPLSIAAVFCAAALVIPLAPAISRVVGTVF
jgi:hypothetical protein